jgi:hypothetical protein
MNTGGHNLGDQRNFKIQNLEIFRVSQKLCRTGKQVLKLPQSSRNNDIKIAHHHNEKGA